MEVPKGELDFDRLARLNLTGGNIHSIALNAAFLAAQINKPVTTPLVLGAARTEFRKLDRSISEAEFITQATKLFSSSELKSLKMHCLGFRHGNH